MALVRSPTESAEFPSENKYPFCVFTNPARIVKRVASRDNSVGVDRGFGEAERKRHVGRVPVKLGAVAARKRPFLVFSPFFFSYRYKRIKKERILPKTTLPFIISSILLFSV